MLPPSASRHGLAAALVGDVDQVGAGLLVEQLAGDVRRAADARCAVGHALGILLRVARSVPAASSAGNDGCATMMSVRIADLAHRRQVLQRVEGEVGEHVRIDDDRAVEAQHQRVAVGRRDGDTPACRCCPTHPPCSRRSTCCPRRFDRASATTRPLVSVTPPGANGTTRRIGLSGYAACATSQRQHAGGERPAQRLFSSSAPPSRQCRLVEVPDVLEPHQHRQVREVVERHRLRPATNPRPSDAP